MPIEPDTIEHLLGVAVDLEATWCDAPVGDEPMCRRLRDSVIRPLRQATECAGYAPGMPEPAGDEHRSAGDLHERVWGLARMATELCVRLPLVRELSEATAALQDMVLEAADEATAAHRHAELSRITVGLGTRNVIADNGTVPRHESRPPDTPAEFDAGFGVLQAALAL